MCRIAKVTRSGYYRWLRGGSSTARKEMQDRLDFQLILEAYRYRGYDKGVMGIYMRLLHQGIRMNHKKIRRLMRKYGLSCPIRKANPYKKMLKALQCSAVADNRLNREFKKYGCRKVLLTDITYIPLNGGRFCYLSAILDAYTMQVLSYVLSDSLKIDFVKETCEKLIRDHGMELYPDTMIHSDQGIHYRSSVFQDFPKKAGILQSMSRKGNCWDNAPQESLFGHMKDDLHIKARKWSGLDDARQAIDDWMDYYNNDRYQMGLMKMSPNEFYEYTAHNILPEFMKILEH